MGIIIKKADESKPILMENVLFDFGMTLILDVGDEPSLTFNFINEEGVKNNTFSHLYLQRINKKLWKYRLLLWIMRRFGVDAEVK